MFHEVAKIVPAGVSGDAEIIHTRCSKTTRIPTLHKNYPPIRPGIYCSLFIGGELFMSEAPIEWITSRPVIENARGNVLIAGLGIGMILPAILSNSKVDHVCVVEKNQDVINLVAPHYSCEKLVIVHQDINEFWAHCPFDTIFLDIWPTISVENLPEIIALEKKAKTEWARDKDAWIHSWSKDQILEIKAHKKRDKESCCIDLGNGIIVCRRKWEDEYND